MWTKDSEIDIVALDDETKTVYVGECKWSSKKVGEDIYHGLVKKSKKILYYIKGQSNKYLLFSKSRFTDRLKDLSEEKDIILVDCNSSFFNIFTA